MYRHSEEQGADEAEKAEEYAPCNVRAPHLEQANIS
jgi:hypothetical protein